jgi:hypothetical protein
MRSCTFQVLWKVKRYAESLSQVLCEQRVSFGSLHIKFQTSLRAASKVAFCDEVDHGTKAPREKRGRFPTPFDFLVESEQGTARVGALAETLGGHACGFSTEDLHTRAEKLC